MFEKLFSPIKIGNIEVKNRLVFPAITSNHGSESGAITEVAKEFYSEALLNWLRLLNVMEPELPFSFIMREVGRLPKSPEPNL
jgi:hypothetical protein